jgi:hypothetical protein
LQDADGRAEDLNPPLQSWPLSFVFSVAAGQLLRHRIRGQLRHRIRNLKAKTGAVATAYPPRVSKQNKTPRAPTGALRTNTSMVFYGYPGLLYCCSKL